MRYADIKKSFDRGPREFKTHVVDKEGDVMSIIEKNVITTTPTTTIKRTAELMKTQDFRRIPIVNAGTNHLEGMAVAIDILDFLGGGEKYNIILEDYDHNFLSAINCPVRKIMRSPTFLDRKASIKDVVKVVLEEHTSAIPILNDDKLIMGIVTERDLLPISDSFGIEIGEVMQKKVITASTGMMISDVSKIMVRNGFRRLPVIQEDELIGVVTVFDVLGFLSDGDFNGIDVEDVLSERVEKIMEKEVITTTPDQDLAEISKLVNTTGIGGFPVVEDDKLVGIVTISEIIRGVYC